MPEEKKATDINVNGNSYKREYVKGLNSFDKFYEAYKGLSYTQYPEDVQRTKMQADWDIIQKEVNPPKQPPAQKAN